MRSSAAKRGAVASFFGMTRAVAAAIVGAALVLSACSNGGTSAAAASPCPLLAELARTGDSVATADVADPAKFDETLRSAVADYVRTARSLRSAVPPALRPDVERLVAAAEAYRFTDAVAARANIDEYARTECETSSSG